MRAMHSLRTQQSLRRWLNTTSASHGVPMTCLCNRAALHGSSVAASVSKYHFSTSTVKRHEKELSKAPVKVNGWIRKAFKKEYLYIAGQKAAKKEGPVQRPSSLDPCDPRSLFGAFPSQTRGAVSYISNDEYIRYIMPLFIYGWTIVMQPRQIDLRSGGGPVDWHRTCIPYLARNFVFYKYADLRMFMYELMIAMSQDGHEPHITIKRVGNDAWGVRVMSYTEDAKDAPCSRSETGQASLAPGITISDARLAIRLETVYQLRCRNVLVKHKALPPDSAYSLRSWHLNSMRDFVASQDPITRFAGPFNTFPIAPLDVPRPNFTGVTVPADPELFQKIIPTLYSRGWLIKYVDRPKSASKFHKGRKFPVLEKLCSFAFSSHAMGFMTELITATRKSTWSPILTLDQHVVSVSHPPGWYGSPSLSMGDLHFATMAERIYKKLYKNKATKSIVTQLTPFGQPLTLPDMRQDLLTAATYDPPFRTQEKLDHKEPDFAYASLGADWREEFDMGIAAPPEKDIYVSLPPTVKTVRKRPEIPKDQQPHEEGRQSTPSDAALKGKDASSVVYQANREERGYPAELEEMEVVPADTLPSRRPANIISGAPRPSRTPAPQVKQRRFGLRDEGADEGLGTLAKRGEQEYPAEREKEVAPADAPPSRRPVNIVSGAPRPSQRPLRR